MSLTKWVLIGAGAAIGGGLIFSLAMIPLGRPTLWELPAAPKLANTEHLIRSEGSPDYSWTVYQNDAETGLLPCGDYLDAEDDQSAAFCADDGEVRFEKRSAKSWDLLSGGTHYRYRCEPGSSMKDALLQCELDTWGSLFPS